MRSIIFSFERAATRNAGLTSARQHAYRAFGMTSGYNALRMDLATWRGRHLLSSLRLTGWFYGSQLLQVRGARGRDLVLGGSLAQRLEILQKQIALRLSLGDNTLG